MVGRHVQAALPARGHAAQAAQRHEGERKHAAVRAQAFCAAICNGVEKHVGGLEAIIDVVRHPIVGGAGTAEGVILGNVAEEPLRKRAQVRGEHDVRRVLGKVCRTGRGRGDKARVCRCGHGVFDPKVDVGRADDVLKLDEELSLARGLPIRGALRRILGSHADARRRVNDSQVGDLRPRR